MHTYLTRPVSFGDCTPLDTLLWLPGWPGFTVKAPFGIW
jgi:hypothetical protein